jgi:hypothetical protein
MLLGIWVNGTIWQNMFLVWMMGMKTSSVCWVTQLLVVMGAAMVLSSGLFFQSVVKRYFAVVVYYCNFCNFIIFLMQCCLLFDSMMKLRYMLSELVGVWLQNLQHWYNKFVLSFQEFFFPADAVIGYGPVWIHLLSRVLKGLRGF